MQLRFFFTNSFLLVLLLGFAAISTRAQDRPRILTGAEINRVVPPGFYFEGQIAPTQMRNAAAATFSAGRNLIAALVDTSGYSTEVKAKYEGFLITDSPIRIGREDIETGAYGFGFTGDGKLNIFDIGGKRVAAIDATSDKDIKRPRPLMMSASVREVRLYSGRNYVTIIAR